VNNPQDRQSPVPADPGRAWSISRPFLYRLLQYSQRFASDPFQITFILSASKMDWLPVTAPQAQLAWKALHWAWKGLHWSDALTEKWCNQDK
jgi:hypothetical protein